MAENDWKKRLGVVFSTNPDGTPIGTREFTVIDTVTGEFESLK